MLKTYKDFPTNLKYKFYILSKTYPEEFSIPDRNLKPYQQKVNYDMWTLSHNGEQFIKQEEEITLPEMPVSEIKRNQEESKIQDSLFDMFNSKQDKTNVETTSNIFSDEAKKQNNDSANQLLLDKSQKFSEATNNQQPKTTNLSSNTLLNFPLTQQMTENKKIEKQKQFSGGLFSKSMQTNVKNKINESQKQQFAYFSIKKQIQQHNNSLYQLNKSNSDNIFKPTNSPIPKSKSQPFQQKQAYTPPSLTHSTYNIFKQPNNIQNLFSQKKQISSQTLSLFELLKKNQTQQKIVQTQMKDNNNQTTKQINALKKQLTSLKTKNTELQSTVTRLTTKSDQTQQKLAKIQKINTQLIKSNQNLSNQINTYLTSCRQFNSILQKMNKIQNRNKELQKKLEDVISIIGFNFNQDSWK